MYHIKCAEIWGGIDSADQGLATNSIKASLYCKPFENLKGGDIYYFSVCEKEILTRFAIADVAGHGAQVSEVSGQLFDSLSRNMNAMAGNIVLSDLNKEIWSETNKAITTAAIYTVNKLDAKLSFSTAGHPPFYMNRKGANDWSEITLKNHTPKGNIPLGIWSETHFDEESINIETGDRFFFLTDGLLEVIDGEGQIFGRPKLLSILKHHNDSPPDILKKAILKALKEHMGSTLFRDDLTFMSMEINI